MNIAGLSAALAAGLAIAGGAIAATDGATVDPQSGATRYAATFFAEARPSTAFDMIQRLPGFSFDGGANVRGFGDAAGNVLIDGERPTTKQDDLQSILRRIPADQVERIDVIRGGAPGVDMRGQTVVANVIRKSGRGLSGAVTAANNMVVNDGRDAPRVRLEGSQRSDGRTLEGSLAVGQGIDDSVGPGPHIQTNSAGDPIYAAALRAQGTDRNADATAAYETPLLGGKLRVNGAAGADRYLDVESDTASAASGSDAYRDRVLNDRGELGVHYGRVINAAASFEVLAIQQLQRRSETSHYTALGDDEHFAETDALAESIVRGAFRWRITKDLTVQAAAEGAYNVQDTSTAYQINGVAQVLPAADVKVEERRGQTEASATWTPNRQVTLEASLKLEASTISTLGDLTESKSLIYPKPRAVLTWSPSRSDQIRLRVEREVGQLDFGSFAATGSLNAGGPRAGNPGLLPQDVWVSEATLEHKFWKAADLTLTARHSEINDAVDRIDVLGSDEAGNIGHAREDELKISLTLPLDRLGVSNGLLKTGGTWRASAVVDPTTGQVRPLSALHPFDGDIHFSQDLTSLSSTWGADSYLGFRETYYRFDEIDVYRLAPYVLLFYEYKPTLRWALRMELPNVTDRGFEKTYAYYPGPRGPGVGPDLIDYRAEAIGRMVYFRVRRTFG